jgi:hypothetical protein
MKDRRLSLASEDKKKEKVLLSLHKPKRKCKLPKLILAKLERTRVIAQVNFALPPGGIQH